MRADLKRLKRDTDSSRSAGARSAAVPAAVAGASRFGQEGEKRVARLLRERFPSGACADRRFAPWSAVAQRPRLLTARQPKGETWLRSCENSAGADLRVCGVTENVHLQVCASPARLNFSHLLSPCAQPAAEPPQAYPSAPQKAASELPGKGLDPAALRRRVSRKSAAS
jgi:hypothetical protein